MFADDGVCCEYVETPSVDVRQDPLQFLLQEHSVRNKHLRIKTVSKGPVPPARRVTLKSAFVSVIRCRWSKWFVDSEEKYIKYIDQNHSGIKATWWSVKTPKLGMSSPSKAVVRVTSFCNGTTSILLKIILIGNFPKLPSIKKIPIKITWAQMVDIMLLPFVGAAAPFLVDKKKMKEERKKKMMRKKVKTWAQDFSSLKHQRPPRAPHRGTCGRTPRAAYLRTNHW